VAEIIRFKGQVVPPLNQVTFQLFLFSVPSSSAQIYWNWKQGGIGRGKKSICANTILWQNKLKHTKQLRTVLIYAYYLHAYLFSAFGSVSGVNIWAAFNIWYWPIWFVGKHIGYWLQLKLRPKVGYVCPGHHKVALIYDCNQSRLA